MRVAFFSPLPPARSGIADYSQALLEPLQRLAEIEVFASGAQSFDPAAFDIALYQIGNNDYHGFAYETALRHPGVLVMHESNLHHLIAGITIKRGDWDAYVGECEYNGGEPARAYADRVRRLEVGPDYEGLPMLRRLLENARGVVVHSRFMQDEIRAAGFSGPVAVIPHGAWIPEQDPTRGGQWARHKLGLGAKYPAHRHLRVSQTVQAHCGVIARLCAAGPAGAECQDDPGGGAAPRFPGGGHDSQHGALRSCAAGGLHSRSKTS